MNENQYFITNKKSSYSNFRNTILDTDYYLETKNVYNFS